jgi:hypothetical protein
MLAALTALTIRYAFRTSLVTITSLLGISCATAQSPSFALVGHVEELRLVTPSDPLSAATMTVRGIEVTLPRNLIVTMPGQYLLARDLFRGPAMGAVQAESGLALRDGAPPRVPFEAQVVGNIVNDRYVAAVMRLSQGALHSGAGFIQAIDTPTGELRVGAKNAAIGARVRLNDPTGIYGLGNSEGAKAGIQLDVRFALDSENSPVHANTGYPVCVPRGPSDTKCPNSNRPDDRRRFTCAKPGSPPPAPAAADAPVQDCDPSLPVPLLVGDYITYSGMLQGDGNGGFLIAAHGLTAELGIYTSPNSEPSYLFIEEAIQGTKGELFSGIPQEETTRFRVVGFTTDPSRSVEIRLIDSGRNEVGTSFTGPAGLAPSNGPQLGRFRNTWPSKDDARAVRRDVIATIVGSPNAILPTGLTSGKYVAPIGQYIYPELTSFGIPGFALPVASENFCFLSSGGGTFKSGEGDVSIGRLDPFPESGHPLSQPVGAGTARACDGQ